MNSTTQDSELDVWQPEGYATRIDYSPAVIEELAIAATEGFNRMAHGGVEIGGVLFGVRDPDGVKILAHRALACEYALGPSFALSDNDRRSLDDLLASPQTDRDLSGMQPVGWYHSHTRSEILLSEKDLQLFEQYFPEAWQIALVLRPHRFDPVRASFFFREPDGTVHAVSSRHEFVIRPRPARPLMPAPADRVPADILPAPAALTVPQVPPAIARHPRPEPARAPSGYFRRSWAWSAAVTAVILAGSLLWIGSSRASAGLSLHALDLGGQLRIDWSCEPRVIQQSDGGALEIEDGSRKVLNALSREQLRAGSITYSRTTGNVLVRLMVHGTNQGTLTQMARFLGTPVATAAPMPIASADRSAEADRADEEAGRQALPEKAVEQPSIRRLAEESIKPRGPRETIAVVVAPAPRRLSLPAASIPNPAEPAVPAPPPIAANTAPPMTTFMPRLPALAPAPLKTADPGPAAGKIIWTGKLARRGTIQIAGNRASAGNMTGGLPGGPIRVHVFPAELTQEGLRIFTADPTAVGAPEAPGAQNGWNRTIYVLNPRQAGDISIVETPGQQNAWNRLILRAERSDHSIIVLRWERVPAASSLQAAGDR